MSIPVVPGDVGVPVTVVSGSADNAAKLATARTIALSGGATGSASFDGSTNATIATTLATPTDAVKGGILQISHVDPASGTFAADLVAALIAAGAMANA